MLKRKCITLVAHKNCALGGDSLGKLGMLAELIGQNACTNGGVINHLKHTANGCVNNLKGKSAVIIGIEKHLAVVANVTGHLKVETTLKSLYPVVHSAPVGHN